jgi:sugar lactone lactonase YvrE
MNLSRQLLSSTILGIVAAAGAATSSAAGVRELLIPGEGVFPESITSSVDGSVYVGSPGARAIFRAAPGSSKAEIWIAPGTNGMQAIFGVLADDASQTLWACSNASGPPGAAPAQPATLYSFGLKDGKYKAHFPLPGEGAMCNDIAIGPDGSAYVTDTTNMEVSRLKRGARTLDPWAGSGAYGPKGGVLDGIAVLGDAVIVNALVTSKLFRTPIGPDGAAGPTVEVNLDRPIQMPDGMRSFGKDSLLVAEGGGSGRLTRVTLNGSAGKATTVREGFPDGPVAVTVVGTDAYVLEGQLAAMMRPDPAAKPKPFRAVVVPLGKP